MADDDKDLSWSKPSWTTNAGLRKTKAGEAVKGGGNLAAPITSLPHTQQAFAKPTWTGEVQDIAKPTGDLAKPITSLAHEGKAGDSNLEFAKPAWTKNAGLQATSKGEALKTGKEIARPIGGIKPVGDE